MFKISFKMLCQLKFVEINIFASLEEECCIVKYPIEEKVMILELYEEKHAFYFIQ